VRGSRAPPHLVHLEGQQGAGAHDGSALVAAGARGGVVVGVVVVVVVVRQAALLQPVRPPAGVQHARGSGHVVCIVIVVRVELGGVHRAQERHVVGQPQVQPVRVII
jgi:hypothetical protein